MDTFEYDRYTQSIAFQSTISTTKKTDKKEVK